MKRVSMNDINAYLDGALSEDRRRAVEAALEQDPEAQALVRQYRRQIEELHRLYDSVLDEPVPESMLQVLRRGRPRPQDTNSANDDSAAQPPPAGADRKDDGKGDDTG